MILGENAEVRSGLVLARKQSKTKTENRYNLLNLRSINEDATINKATLDVFDATEKLDSTYLTQPSDIIIRLSAPYTAVLIDQTTTGLLISSNFAVIRADKTKIAPEYLYWYLNTEEIKKDIVKNSARNVIAAIRPQYYAQLQLKDIPLEKQKKIGELNQLAKKELNLLQQLQTEKAKYYETKLNQLYETI